MGVYDNSSRGFCTLSLPPPPFLYPLFLFPRHPSPFSASASSRRLRHRPVLHVSYFFYSSMQTFEGAPPSSATVATNAPKFPLSVCSQSYGTREFPDPSANTYTVGAETPRLPPPSPPLHSRLEKSLAMRAFIHFPVTAIRINPQGSLYLHDGSQVSYAQ